jgi:hypothetical protein
MFEATGMLLDGVSVNNYVVEKRLTLSADQIPQNNAHQPLKTGWRIGEAKREAEEVIVPRRHGESGLHFIFIGDLYLPKPAKTVDH